MRLVLGRERSVLLVAVRLTLRRRGRGGTVVVVGVVGVGIVLGVLVRHGEDWRSVGGGVVGV